MKREESEDRLYVLFVGPHVAGWYTSVIESGAGSSCAWLGLFGQVSLSKQGQHERRTHHQTSYVLDPSLLDTPTHEDDANGCPNKEQNPEREGDEPVKRR